eukprot:6185243-Pleurochrysis_carterae.AAC.3
MVRDLRSLRGGATFSVFRHRLLAIARIRSDGRRRKSTAVTADAIGPGVAPKVLPSNKATAPRARRNARGKTQVCAGNAPDAGASSRGRGRVVAVSGVGGAGDSRASDVGCGTSPGGTLAVDATFAGATVEGAASMLGASRSEAIA